MKLEDRWPVLVTVWRVLDHIKYPGWYARRWLKWKRRPAIGDQVEDCAYKIRTVVAFGDSEDDLEFEDGSRASWMHCCGPVKKSSRRGTRAPAQ